jgi:hypothetical protein
MQKIFYFFTPLVAWRLHFALARILLIHFEGENRLPVFAKGKHSVSVKQGRH